LARGLLQPRRPRGHEVEVGSRVVVPAPSLRLELALEVLRGGLGRPRDSQPFPESEAGARPVDAVEGGPAFEVARVCAGASNTRFSGEGRAVMTIADIVRCKRLLGGVP
jgi:hypothetical protein